MLEFEINTANLDKAIKLMPGALKMQLGDAFDHISLKFLKEFRRTRLKGPPGVRGSYGPGNLFTYFKRASLVPRDGIEGMGMRVWTDSKIARLQEEGGIVKNPSGGKLAVPLSARTEMWTATGKLRSRYKQPRLLRNLIAITLRGKVFLSKVMKRSKTIKPLYVLKNKVRLKPRLGFYATWENMQSTRITILNNAIDKALASTK
jgi:hypothetical protein